MVRKIKKGYFFLGFVLLSFLVEIYTMELVDCYDSVISLARFYFAIFNILFQNSSIQRKKSRRQ